MSFFFYVLFHHRKPCKKTHTHILRFLDILRSPRRPLDAKCERAMSRCTHIAFAGGGRGVTIYRGILFVGSVSSCCSLPPSQSSSTSHSHNGGTICPAHVHLRLAPRSVPLRLPPSAPLRRLCRGACARCGTKFRVHDSPERWGNTSSRLSVSGNKSRHAASKCDSFSMVFEAVNFNEINAPFNVDKRMSNTSSMSPWSTILSKCSFYSRTMTDFNTVINLRSSGSAYAVMLGGTNTKCT